MYRNLRLIDVVVGLHCVGILGVSLPSSLMGIALKCLSGILARARARVTDRLMFQLLGTAPLP
jgi:hypothetical protein